VLGNATDKVQRHRRGSRCSASVPITGANMAIVATSAHRPGCLEVDHEGFGALTLTDASRLLRGGRLRVREDAKSAPEEVARRWADVTACDQAL
jgi:hypothetical protein